MNQLVSELRDAKRREVERYLDLLEQEDGKFQMENTEDGRIQNNLIKMYKNM